MPRRREGVREGRWAVVDYADVIVHIFSDEERDFYNLERLWEDGKTSCAIRTEQFSLAARFKFSAVMRALLD